MLLLTSFSGCIDFKDDDDVFVAIMLSEQNSKSNLETISENNVQNISNENDSNAYDVQNISEEDQKLLKNKMNNFSESLDLWMDSPEFDNFTIKLAKNISKLPRCNIGVPGEVTEYNSGVSNLTNCLHEYKNLAEGLNKDFNLEMPYADDFQINKFTSAAKPDELDDVLTTILLIDQYNSLIDSAGDVVYKDKDSYAKFYTALAVFGVSIILIQENMAYKVSYKIVGTVFIKSGLYKLVSNSGVLKFAMSITHWEIRDEIGSIPSNSDGIISNFKDGNISVNMDTAKETYENLKNESIVKDATGIVENVNVSEAAETVNGIISGFIN
ncbi:hypothetical protein MMOS7_08010 [Methanococcus maripaludis OS7]|uniref:Uncharacterized protein n=2 Tax=Methanococcus maripaludis TaxID=39152 RepID=A0A2Z5PSI5_METMI|nr:hypothetical protein MMOS7_08010 [Methanococcus maripaludis OS7]